VPCVLFLIVLTYMTLCWKGKLAAVARIKASKLRGGTNQVADASLAGAGVGLASKVTAQAQGDAEAAEVGAVAEKVSDTADTSMEMVGIVETANVGDLNARTSTRRPRPRSTSIKTARARASTTGWAAARTAALRLPCSSCAIVSPSCKTLKRLRS
jgi:hypothetical protein